MIQPKLKIVGLHLRELGPIRALDLPEQAPGWDGFPDVALIGGVNGSGKTTLLEFLYTALSLFNEESRFFEKGLGFLPSLPPPSLVAKEALLDFQIELEEFEKWTLDPPGPMQKIRFVSRDSGKVGTESAKGNYGILPQREKWVHFSGPRASTFAHLIRNASLRPEITIPSVVYLPSDRRDLFVYGEKAKAFDRVEEPGGFAQRWTPPPEWKDSLEARLYNARWKDLNFKEEGKPEQATHFATYAKAFSDFWGGGKQLTWHEGELFVEIARTQERHPLSELSSGEKQIMVLVSELLLRWRPGSLILIDEPELHLHTAWQTQFFALLLRWQKERGGQVILTTQSNHLFRIADPNTVFLLGRENL